VSVEEGRQLLLKVASDPELAERLSEPSTSTEAKQRLLATLGFGGVSRQDVESAASALSGQHAQLQNVERTAMAQGTDVAGLLKRAHDLAFGFCNGGGAA
jgi:hypothetical protein